MEDADSTCIAVALVVNDAPESQRFMIEKNENGNPVYKKAYESYVAKWKYKQCLYWVGKGRWRKNSLYVTNKNECNLKEIAILYWWTSFFKVSDNCFVEEVL